MELINTYSYEIKKSKFIGYLYKIKDDTEVKILIKALWEDNKKARHIPYAYRLKNTAGKTDDKEPNNTAGMPILKVLERTNMEGYLIAIVRYFGGTKLGAGPLLRSYSLVANEVIKVSDLG